MTEPVKPKISPGVSIEEWTYSRFDASPYVAMETITLLRERGYIDLPYPGFNIAHLEKMINDMGECTDTYKNMRYLGWLQAACVAMSGGKLTLDDCRKINRGKI